jgi:Flp pilus assembly pilin Flp
MHDRLLSTYVKLQILLSGERGQDQVEYGLLRTLILIVMIRSISPIATLVSHFFTNVSTSLA